jgi:uncharacterized membrane protein
MTDQTDCQFESKVLTAVRTGAWGDDLKDHLAGCAGCREVVRVASALHVIAEETPIPTSLPNYRLVWLKAQVLQNQRRITRLELIGKLGTLAAVVVAAAVIALWTWLGSSTHQTPIQSMVDWRHTLTVAAPLIIALVLTYAVTKQATFRQSRNKPY